jgi:hypothetical protein
MLQQDSYVKNKYAVEELKIEIDQLLAEYLFSSQISEACRCVKQLQVILFLVV